MAYSADGLRRGQPDFPQNAVQEYHRTREWKETPSGADRITGGLMYFDFTGDRPVSHCEGSHELGWSFCNG